MYETAISLFAIRAVETFGWGIDVNLKFFEEELSGLKCANSSMGVFNI